MLRSVLNSISRPFFIAVSPDVSESDNKNHMQYSRTQHIAHDIKNVSPSSGIDAKIQAVGKVLHEKSKDEKSKMASRFLESLPAKREDSNTAISINLGLQLNPAQFVLVTHQAAVHANDVGSALPLESNSQSSGVGGSASAIVPWYGISGLDRRPINRNFDSNKHTEIGVRRHKRNAPYVSEDQLGRLKTLVGRVNPRWIASLNFLKKSDYSGFESESGLPSMKLYRLASRIYFIHSELKLVELDEKINGVTVRNAIDAVSLALFEMHRSNKFWQAVGFALEYKDRINTDDLLAFALFHKGLPSGDLHYRFERFKQERELNIESSQDDIKNLLDVHNEKPGEFSIKGFARVMGIEPEIFAAVENSGLGKFRKLTVLATMDTKKYRNISLKDVSDWQYFHNRLEGSSLYEKDAGDASFERAELLFRIKFFCQDRRLNRDELAALVSTEKHDSWLTIRGKEAILELEKEKMEKFFIDEKPLLRRDMTSKDLLSWKHEASSPQFLLTWFLHSKYFTKEDIRKINLLEEKLSANEITPDEWKAKAIEDGFSEEKIKNIEEYKGKLSAFTESEISSVTRHAAGHFAHKHGLSPDIFQDMVRYNENVLKSRPS